MSGKRCFQFGLRKLLLWTAVVALYLGILRMLNVGLLLSVVLTCHVLYVGILRVIGLRAAAVGSLCIGICIGVFASSWVPLDLPGVSGVGDFLADPIVALVLGCLLGLFVLGAVELTFRVVDEVDNLTQSKEAREASDGIIKNVDFNIATVYCPFCGVSTDFHEEVIGTVQPCANCGRKIFVERESGSWLVAILIGFPVFLACACFGCLLLWTGILMWYYRGAT